MYFGTGEHIPKKLEAARLARWKPSLSSRTAQFSCLETVIGDIFHPTTELSARS